MPTTIKLWEVAGKMLHAVPESTLAQGHKKEADLEDWIAASPQVIADDVLIFDRQRDVGVGKLDLLGIDEDGTLVIIELKRGRAPREAIAQALDYASWINSADEVEILQNAESYLKAPFQQAFKDFFQREEVPEISGENHRILLVAARLDTSAERIINYLSTRHGVDINAVFFQHARLSDGKELIARTTLVGDEDRPHPPGGRRPRPTAEGLMAAASECAVAPLVEVCRRMSGQLEENVSNIHGGCFRYIARNPAGQPRLVLGINIPGKYSPPQGQLDVWIPRKNLAEVAARTESEVRSILEKQPVLDMQIGDCWIRLTSEAQAEALLTQLLTLVTQPSTANV